MKESGGCCGWKSIFGRKKKCGPIVELWMKWFLLSLQNQHKVHRFMQPICYERNENWNVAFKSLQSILILFSYFRENKEKEKVKENKK